MPFALRKIPPTLLRADLANIGEVFPSEITKAMKGPQGPQVRAKLCEEMLVRAERGSGVTSLPDPLRQSGLECQTLALLNGIQAVAGRSAVTGLLGRVEDIRQIAQKYSSPENARFDISTICYVLRNDFGLPLRQIPENRNPIRVVDELFRDRRFIGFSFNRSFHALSAVPVMKPTDSQFVLKMDSLGAKLSWYSLDTFIDEILGLKYLTKMLVYEFGESE